MPDSPELERFKAQVVEVAQRYAREHDLCEVVDEALKEMGLDKMNEFTKVKVLVHVPMVVPVEVRAGLLTGDEQARAAKLQELLASAIPTRANILFNDERVMRQIRTARGRTDERAMPEVGPPAVIEVTEWNPDPQPTRAARRMAPGVPGGYVARYMSAAGRRQHYVRENDIGYSRALCGASSYGWVEHSTRVSEGVCQRCIERAASR